MKYIHVVRIFGKTIHGGKNIWHKSPLVRIFGPKKHSKNILTKNPL